MGLKAVVLLSGGLDSATVLAMAQAQDYELYALTVEYGQRHHQEIHCARAQAQARQVAQHKILHLELPDSRASALTDTAALPSAQPDSLIPATYVPARNTILLSLALSWAEALGSVDIFIGATAVDYSGYPDCRAVFIEAFEKLANLATKAAVQDGKKFCIHAPLLDLPKHKIIARGLELGQCQLKFVLKKPTDFEEIKEVLNQLGQYCLPEDVLLMPQALNRRQLARRSTWVTQLCKQHGYRFCSRLQILLYGNQPGT